MTFRSSIDGESIRDRVSDSWRFSPLAGLVIMGGLVVELLINGAIMTLANGRASHQPKP